MTKKNEAPVRKKRKRRRLKASIRRNFRQTLIVILTGVLLTAAFFYIALLIVLKGPSPTFSNMVVSTMWETRRGKAIVQAMFTEEEIEAILSKNSVENANTIANVTKDDYSEYNITEDKKNTVDIIDVSGGTFKGKLMIVYDPSRIELGVNSLMPGGNTGYSVQDYVSEIGGLGGINGGGFDDPNGKGDGSIPQGIVIHNSQIVFGSPEDYECLIGFNNADHLIVGYMTGQDALDWGMTDAVTFGPVLVYDGHACAITGNGGGLNPRTIIGQRADGAVLLLVIDGRQTSSIGASYEDCINIMLENNAIVAANLDGGSSSVMYYNGEIINNVVSMNGERLVPTAWVVK